MASGGRKIFNVGEMRGRVPQRGPCACWLEVEFHRHLDEPRSAEGGDLAERGGAAETGHRIVPIGVVQDVEEVGTELHLEPLTHLELPAHGNVKISLARSIEGVAPEIAEPVSYTHLTLPTKRIV